jgi:hypothetical protein
MDQEPRVLKAGREHEVACLLGDPASVWVGAHAGEVDSSGLDLDEEQNVVAAQERGLDREEVAGDDAGRLCLQELAPARP